MRFVCCLGGGEAVEEMVLTVCIDCLIVCFYDVSSRFNFMQISYRAIDVVCMYVYTTNGT